LDSGAAGVLEVSESAAVQQEQLGCCHEAEGERSFHLKHILGLLLTPALAGHPAIAASACESPAPGLAQRVAITWSTIQGATAYRVGLQSRIPNGRVLAQHDAVIPEPRFVPPQPLTNYRAKVTIRLTSICGKETSAESVSWFTVDAAATCSEGQTEKRAHALSDGRLITAQESRSTLHIESARPLCTGARGEASYRVVAPN
jgi:hypothetical protein